MSHLSFETVARLVDEAPTALEAAHLATCEACRQELQDMHAQVAELGTLPELQPARDDWEKIERRLEAEGLIRARSPRRAYMQYGMRAAAALALLLVGTLAGRMSRGDVAPASPLASAPSSPSAGAPQVVQQPATQVSTELQPTQTSPGDARLVSTQPQRAPRTAEEYLQHLRATEAAYLDALTNFAEISGSTTTGDLTARLAALEAMVLTTRAALGEAPTDPVINGYHLTAVAQRDATLKQIAATNNNSWF